MGACLAKNLTDEEKAAAKKNKEIDAELYAERKKIKEEIKLLLLGPGESGKSTIFKQMKIISLVNSGWSQDEMNTWKNVVYFNILSQAKVIANACVKLGIEMDNDGGADALQKLLDLSPEGENWDPEVAKDVTVLWKDAGFQKAYEMRDKEFQLNDSTAYFFDDIDRFAKQDYQPSQQDILRARIRSLGIEEAMFNLDGLEFKMVDVGGQRSERRKWIHCFECVTAVLYTASLSEYDQTLREDNSQNRMKESLLLFDEICNSPYFEKTDFILFLNKTDLLKEKISKADDLKVLFKEYTGGKNFEAASNFIKEKYLAINGSPHRIHTHFTCAVDTDSILFVFKSVKETLLREVMEQIF